MQRKKEVLELRVRCEVNKKNIERQIRSKCDLHENFTSSKKEVG